LLGWGIAKQYEKAYTQFCNKRIDGLQKLTMINPENHPREAVRERRPDAAPQVTTPGAIAPPLLN
jgi:hypothetical protein